MRPPTSWLALLALLSFPLLVSGCADDPYCAGNLVCAELSEGGYACHHPLLLTGMVFDASSEAAIEGAHVLALDDQATAVTDVAVSDADGNYELNLAVARDADGAPVQAIFTLRASAQNYQTFPSGLRTALPISTTEAGAEEPGWIIQTAVTDIALLPLAEDEQGMMSISGAVLADDSSGGVLVVAEGGATGLSGIGDLGGAYTIFNVPDGSYTVRGYAAGVQLEPVEVEMEGADLTGIDLVESSAYGELVWEDDDVPSASGGEEVSVEYGGPLESGMVYQFRATSWRTPGGTPGPISMTEDLGGVFFVE